MKNKNLCEFFKHYEGQPVEIFTDDGRVLVGIDVDAYDSSVRVIDECGRMHLIEYFHIDSVVEPQMKLQRYCRHGRGNFDAVEEEGCGCGCGGCGGCGCGCAPAPCAPAVPEEIDEGNGYNRYRCCY